MPCHSCDGIGMIWQTVMCLVVAGDVWCRRSLSWWRYQKETFAALLALCAGNSPVTGEFPAQRPVTRNFDVFFDLRLNKRLSKQSWGSWFETTSRPLWRHSNVNDLTNSYVLDRKQWNQHAMSPHNYHINGTQKRKKNIIGYSKKSNKIIAVDMKSDFYARLHTNRILTKWCRRGVKFGHFHPASL